MKARHIAIFVFLFATILCLRGTESKAESLDQWDLTKEYTLEQGSVKYYAYLTKDRRESWIYKVELLDKKKMLDVVFPKEVEGAPVVCLGYTWELYGKDSRVEWTQNLFGTTMPDSCDTEGRPFLKLLTVRSVVMPDSVREMGPCAFALMGNLKYVHLSSNLTRLESYTFWGCKDLKKIDFPSKVKIADLNVFLYCDSLI